MGTDRVTVDARNNTTSGFGSFILPFSRNGFVDHDTEPSLTSRFPSAIARALPPPASDGKTRYSASIKKGPSGPPLHLPDVTIPSGERPSPTPVEGTSPNPVNIQVMTAALWERMVIFTSSLPLGFRRTTRPTNTITRPVTYSTLSQLLNSIPPKLRRPLGLPEV